MHEIDHWLIVISDLHCGSRHGLLPRGMFDQDKAPISLTTKQEWLIDRWHEFTREWIPNITRGSPFSVLLNGDAVEGVHHGGAELVSHHVTDHVLIAERLLLPLRNKAKNFWVVRGTESHVGLSAANEESLAKLLNATTADEKYYSHWELNIELEGKLINAAHHARSGVNPAANVYQRFVASRARHGQQIPDIFIRSHLHEVSYFKTDKAGGWIHSIVTRPWQAMTGYAHKAVPEALSFVGSHAFGITRGGEIIEREISWQVPSEPRFLINSRTPKNGARSSTSKSVSRKGRKAHSPRGK